MPGIKELVIKSVKKDKYQKYIELIPELKSEKNEKMVMIILTILAFIVLGVFAVKPTISTIVSLQKQLEDSRFYDSKLQEKIDNLAKLDKQYSTIQNDLPLVYDAIPKTSQIATLAASIKTISDSSNVSIKNLQIQNVAIDNKTVATKKYSSFDYNISSEGNYQNLMTLADNLINFQRILTINSVSIVKSTVLTETTLQININGNSFFKP